LAVSPANNRDAYAKNTHEQKPLSEALEIPNLACPAILKRAIGICIRIYA
jgi:hypothetical protein